MAFCDSAFVAARQSQEDSAKLCRQHFDGKANGYQLFALGKQIPKKMCECMM